MKPVAINPYAPPDTLQAAQHTFFFLWTLRVTAVLCCLQLLGTLWGLMQLWPIKINLPNATNLILVLLYPALLFMAGISLFLQRRLVLPLLATYLLWGAVKNFARFDSLHSVCLLSALLIFIYCCHLFDKNKLY